MKKGQVSIKQLIKHKLHLFSIWKTRIAPQLILLLIIIVTVPLLIIGYYSSRATRSSLLKAAQEQMLLETKDIASDLENLVIKTHAEVDFLAEVPPIQGIIRARENHGLDTIGKSTLDLWINQLNTLLSSSSSKKQIFRSIMYVNEFGEVIAGVDNDGVAVHKMKKGEYKLVRGEEFFIETSKLPPGDNTYTSKIKLNYQSEHFMAYFECAFPIFNPLTFDRRGMIVVVVDATSIYNKLKNSESTNNWFFIASEEGEFMYISGGARLPQKVAQYFNDSQIWTEKDLDNTTYEVSQALINKNSDSEVNWRVLNSTPTENLFVGHRKFVSILWIITIIVLLFVVIFSLIISKKFTKTLKFIEVALSSISQGKHPKELKITSRNEIGQMASSLNNLIINQREISKFAKEMGKGNLSVDFTPQGESDILGNSLLDMCNNLTKTRKEEVLRKKEDDKRIWITSGIAKFSDILRQNASGLTSLSENILYALIDYLEVNQGGLFILDDDGEAEKQMIRLTACVAYDRVRTLKKEIELDEGLIGRCVEEGEMIYMTEIPNDYIKITSGLGNRNPNVLLIVPLKVNEKVLGAIELASLKPLEKYQIEFVEQVAESIASTLSSVRINQRTVALLAQSQEQSEEMSAQEEEMRQNIEELQATQEESNRREAEIQSVLDALSETSILFEYNTDGMIINANEDAIHLFGLDKNEVIGRHHYDFHTLAQDKLKYKEFWQKLIEGIPLRIISHIKVINSEYWLSEIYSPILTSNGKVLRILNVATDISNSKLQELELKSQTETLEAQEEEMRSNIEIMHTIQRESEQNHSEVQSMLTAIQSTLYYAELTPDGTIISLNSAYLTLLDARIDHVKGKKYSEIVSIRNIENFNNEIRQGKIKHRTSRLMIKGIEYWMSETYTPVRTQKGEVAKILVLSSDITKNRKQEEQLREKAEETMAQDEMLRFNIEELNNMQKDYEKEIKSNKKKINQLIAIISRRKQKRKRK